MLTGKQASSYIGRTGTLHLNGSGRPGWMQTPDKMAVKVKVLDAREAFGRVDLFVQPVAGEGAAWVEARRVTLEEVADAGA